MSPPFATPFSSVVAPRNVRTRRGAAAAPRTGARSSSTNARSSASNCMNALRGDWRMNCSALNARLASTSPCCTSCTNRRPNLHSDSNIGSCRRCVAARRGSCIVSIQCLHYYCRNIRDARCCARSLICRRYALHDSHVHVGSYTCVVITGGAAAAAAAAATRRGLGCCCCITGGATGGAAGSI